MKYYIVIPAYNEEAFIALTLQSLVSQTLLPKKVVVVNDNSTDKTAEIVLAFAKENPFITLVNKTSEAIHLPGSKVIQAFHKGFETLDIKLASALKRILRPQLRVVNTGREKLLETTTGASIRATQFCAGSLIGPKLIHMIKTSTIPSTCTM